MSFPGCRGRFWYFPWYIHPSSWAMNCKGNGEGSTSQATIDGGQSAWGLSRWGKLTFKNWPDPRGGKSLMAEKTAPAHDDAMSQSIGFPRRWYCDNAIAGQPWSAASRAAATVPEWWISTPRFPPALIPERTQPGWSSLSVAKARRTQSAGVPLTW